MVLKPTSSASLRRFSFESDVISDGTQTEPRWVKTVAKFESDVISDGTQTADIPAVTPSPFESDVISDGTQTL